MRLSKALIKYVGIEMHAATKQAFKIMFRWYFSIKVECVSTFWSTFFCNSIYFWMCKTSFQLASADSWQLFRPLKWTFVWPGNLRLTFFLFSNYKYFSVKYLCTLLGLFSSLRITSAILWTWYYVFYIS